MDLITDWRFLGFLITNFVTITGFFVIKFNDFRHLEDDVKKISKNLDKQAEKINNIDKNLAVLEQKTLDLEKSKK